MKSALNMNIENGPQKRSGDQSPYRSKVHILEIGGLAIPPAFAIASVVRIGTAFGQARTS